MFIDRIPNRRSPPAILLRESFRQDGKSRKRTLANLSRLPKHVVDALDALLKGTTQTPPSGAFDIVRTLPHGHAAAVLGSLRNCGIDRIIAPRRSPQRDLVAGMIAARILEPSSKLAMVRRFAPETATSTLADELRLPAEEIDENLLYEAMDWLVERQEAIERRLAGKHLEEGALVLMTSAWSYSRCCPLVRHGYSRDGKKGVPQIEFGLLCDRAGWPVAIEAFKGNTADPSTVAAQIGKLRRRFKWVVLVGDRGMLTDARIREDVKPAGLDWISALRAPGVRALVANGALQPSLFDERDMAEITCEELYPGERLVVCRNPLLAKERARKREALLRAAETALEAAAEATKRSKNRLKGEKNISERVGRAVAKYKMKKHFVFEIAADTFSWRRNDDSIAAEAALDGFYVPACRRNSSTLARPLPPTKISVPSNARSAPSSSSTSTCGQSITAWKTVCAPICCYACWPIMSNATCASSLRQCCSTMKTDRCGPRLWHQPKNQSPHSARLLPGEPLTAIPSTASDPCSTTSPRETAFGPGSPALGR